MPSAIEHLGVEAVKQGAIDYLLIDRDSPAIIGRVIYFAIQQFQLRSEIEKARSMSLELSSLKQRFLNRVGKEFLTPLNGILGTIDVLMEDALPERYQNSLSHVSESARALRLLVDDVLAISTDTPLTEFTGAQRFNLQEEFNRIMGLLRIECESQAVALIYDFADLPTLPLTGELPSLKQLFVLVVTHLSRALSPASVIRVASKCTVMDAATDAVFAHFIFGFSDSKRSSPLHEQDVLHPMARELTGQLKGRMWSSISHETGGAVHVVVPLFVATPEEDLFPTPEEELDPSLRPVLNCLVVDDNSINRMVIAKWLERRGHKTAIANNGLEALQKADSDQFDVIFMDIQMPELDGYEATKILRTMPAYRDVPIYAVSAHIQHEDLGKCKEMGMNGAFIKPVNIKSLLELTKVLERRGAGLLRQNLGFFRALFSLSS